MRLPFYLLLSCLVITGLQSQAQIARNLVSIDTCANYFIVDEALTGDYTTAGTFIFLHQHRGASINTDNDANFGSLVELNGSGRYELNRVAAVNGDTIFAQFKLRHDYLIGGNSTSVTFALPVTTTINSPLSPAPFDGSNGGILLLGSEDPITIGSNIDVAALGMAGGAESIRDSDCGFLTSANNYFYDLNNWRGAFKGQGAAATSFLIDRETGRGPNLNGGGGGNDHNAGGGGGANITNGGDGASNEEPGFFNCKGNFPGLGGRALPGSEDGTQRIYFGGGGGAGHGNNPNPTAGGNGGGIIIISAPAITFVNAPTLSVKGGDAQQVTGDGGAGGGAGGSILLFTESVAGEATFDLRGGNGANVDNEGLNRCFGPGGGGSGGRLLYNGPPTGEWTLLVEGGSGGESINSEACSPGENQGQNGAIGITEAAIQQPQSIQEVLNYPSEAIVLDEICVGAPLQIGNLDDESCFAAQWFIGTPNAFESLAGNPNYGPTNQPALTILTLPDPVIGNLVEYRLERYGQNGELVAVLSIQIPLIEGPTAAFDSDVTELSVDFTNNSNGASSVQWFFGDGNNSIELSPSHTYTASGSYDVTLIAFSDCGNDTLVQTVTVAATAPTAIIGFNNTDFCVGDTLYLYNLSENATSIEWSSSSLTFSPNNTADTVFAVLELPGTAEVVLTAQNVDVQDNSSQSFQILPPPSYELSTAVTGSLFTGSANGQFATSLTWDIAGVGQFTGEAVEVSLPGPGLYDVSFTASNGVCDDQIIVFTVEVIEPTVAAIDQTITAGCAPLFVQFTNASTGPVDSVQWVFPGGSPASGNQNVESVNFTEAGNYEVSLTVFSPNGPQTVTQNIEVYEPPIAAFTATEDQGLLTTVNLSTSADSYQWDFGDGNGSSDFEPSHQYQAIGTYEVTLNAFNNFCSRAIGQTIFVDMINNLADISSIGLKAYPNPNSGVFVLEGPAGYFEITNMLGQTVVPQQAKGSNSQEIDLSSLANGTYLLRFSLDDKLYIMKLNKQ